MSSSETLHKPMCRTSPSRCARATPWREVASGVALLLKWCTCQRGSRGGPEGVQRGSRGGPEGVQRKGHLP
eukprot:1175572-Prorocentrum_minimum.AAC.2